MSEAFLRDFQSLMSPEEQEQLRKAGMGQRMGFGRNPALLIVDAQKFELGAVDDDDTEEYPSACKTAREAIPVIARLAAAFRTAGRPVIYAQMVLRRDGLDYGRRHHKRPFRNIEGWCLENSKGGEIVRDIAPEPGDSVLKKTRPSCFHATPLLDQLIAANVDTVVITGGSTSNCVRATAIDCASYNFFTSVVREAVFDRIRISHEVSLMDIDRQLGDVVAESEVHAYLDALPTADDRPSHHQAVV
jgi:nicotinamidase-related amidase